MNPSLLNSLPPSKGSDQTTVSEQTKNKRGQVFKKKKLKTEHVYFTDIYINIIIIVQKHHKLIYSLDSRPKFTHLPHMCITPRLSLGGK